jgi:2-polyprenyl-6-methoxyphenol hydroxylase-like FAD-dependent oxidoreductase
MAAEAARFGLRYRIIDKAAHGALQSQALVLHARTLEQFERYELAQRAVELGRRLHRIRIYSDGSRILEASFEDIPGNYPFVLFLPQSETERLLTEHLEAQGGAIERGVALEYVEQREDEVECVLIGKTGARDTVSAAYLIGADGANSTVRELLGVPVETTSPEFTFLLGDVRLVGDVPGDELALHLHGGNLVFLGRIDKSYFRVIVTRQNGSASSQARLGDFQDAIDEVGIENLRVSDPRWMEVFRVSERRTTAFSRGRVFLAGDATNIHSPIGGQGLNMGIQDAANLLWKISLVESRRARPSLLESYDRERKPLSDALQQGTAAAIRAASASNWLLELVRDGILSRIGTFEAVQERLRSTVSQLGFNYRGSPIVRDCAGTSNLQAGDRAPDCEVTDETGVRFRIFDLFKEPMHTALMVTPAPGVDLERFARLFSTYRDIMHGMVLIDGDGQFRTHYVQSGGALYVVRPDGYIGFRGSPNDLDALEAWCDGLFLAPAKR